MTQTEVRKYIQALLKDSLDVGGKVFTIRPSELLQDELPCVTVTYGACMLEAFEGSQHSTKEYECKQTVFIDILAQESHTPSIAIDQAAAAEDLLDSLARQVLLEVGDDSFFNKQYVDYDQDADNSTTGLVAGHLFRSIEPYNFKGKDNKVFIGNRMELQVEYREVVAKVKRAVPFDSANMKINKSGYDDDTVDPTLLESQVNDINQS